jgi:hypothetical protein
MTGLIKKGTRLRVVAEHEMSALVHWKSPFTSGFKCVPAIGTVLIVTHDQMEGAPAFVALPDDYDSFERLHVPVEDREWPTYDGYSLVVEAAEVGHSLELIP